MSKRAHIVVVAPIHNEEANVAELANRVIAATEPLSKDFRLVLVDDGSRDRSWAEICAAAKRDKRVIGVRLNRNFGQHSAIAAGLRAEAGDWVIVMDGDLQDRPEVIPELYEKALSEGHDVIFVARQERPEGMLYQFAQGIFYSTLRNFTGTDYDPAHGNFSIISHRVQAALNELPEDNRFYGGLIEWLGFKRATLQAKHGERHAGDTSYSFRSRFIFARNIILSFSTRPLSYAIVFGALVVAMSFVFGVWIYVKALFFGYSIEGWASIMVSIYFLGGVQLMMIGMNGAYVGRISDTMKNRPVYLVAERTDDETCSPET